MQKAKEIKDTLIALWKYRMDFDIAFNQHWYRIPVKSAPPIVIGNNLKYVAFYQPKTFGEHAFSIRWFAEVKNIEIKKGFELSPLLRNEKSDKEYYKIEFDRLEEIHPLILSYRHRRITFITTTYKRFEIANEINDLYYESPIEEKVWEALKEEKIDAERQYDVIIPEPIEKKFILDFAIFCKNRNLGIECDGDTYHLKEDDVKNDKIRENILVTNKWNIVRYTSDDINLRLNDSIMQVKEAINNYGGFEEKKNRGNFKYVESDKSQDRLFDI